ncbi:MAG: XRE family transcriptional regulator [Alphaproteobacteria bacterium]|nr:XRE family transcriptional regulator [Alphaproteobacteria bacterium]
MKKNKHVGSSFDEFLAEQGIGEEVAAHAAKRVLAWQISEAMKAKGIRKIDMARRMKTSRSQLDRLLDPENSKVLLETLQRAATAVGKRVTITLENER